MSKLISAGFKRLFSLKSLYVCLAIIAFEVITSMIGSSSIVVTVNDDAVPLSVNGFLNASAIIVLIAAAVVIGNFIGSEYSFGTMRNKLVVGHNRTEIYFANYIVSFAGTLIMLAFGAVLVFAVGLPLGAVTENGIVELLLLELLFAFVVTALCVFIAMCIQSKSNALTLGIILGVVMLFVNIVTAEMLAEPEFIYPPDQPPVSNPNYLSGTTRVVHEAVDTILPCSALFEYTGEIETDKVIAEVCETVIFTAAGVFIFRKRDLK